MDPTDAIQREAGLRQELSPAQIKMIGLGTAIGTGLFMGSGIAIGYAGPAVLLSYLIAGVIAMIMVFSLSEMAVVHPTAGSLGTYAEIYLGEWAGFTVRHTYWMAQIIASGGEAVAAGIYMTYWFPTVPVWLWAISFVGAITYINSRSVSSFGSVEYWFVLIKVVAIALFIVLGFAAFFGVGDVRIGFDNLIGPTKGFMPNGIHGVWMGVLVAIFSFYGVEVISVTSGEAKDPVRTLPQALRSMALRLFCLYMLSLTIIVCLVPWEATGADDIAESPFVRLFDHVGVRHAAGIMNFVILTAALSGINSSLYLCSRMLFSLSRANYISPRLGQLTSKGAPAISAAISAVGMLLVASISVLTPHAYRYLLGVALFGGIIVWIFVLASHISFRRRWSTRDLPIRTPLFPFLQIIGLMLLSAALVTMGLDTEYWYVSWVVGIPWLVLVTAYYLIWRVRKDRSQAAFDRRVN